MSGNSDECWTAWADKTYYDHHDIGGVRVHFYWTFRFSRFRLNRNKNALLFSASVAVSIVLRSILYVLLLLNIYGSTWYVMVVHFMGCILYKIEKRQLWEYDRWVVKTQLCKLRDTSDTLIRRSCYIPFVMLKNSTGACLWAAVLFWPPFGRSPSSSSLHSVRKYKDRLVDDIDIQTVFTLTDIVVQVTYQVQLSSMTRTVDHCVSRTVIPPGEQLIIYQGVYFAIYCRSKQVKSKKSGTYVQGNGQLQ